MDHEETEVHVRATGKGLLDSLLILEEDPLPHRQAQQLAASSDPFSLIWLLCISLLR
jgi:hypothetical protein